MKLTNISTQQVRKFPDPVYSFSREDLFLAGVFKGRFWARFGSSTAYFLQQHRYASDIVTTTSDTRYQPPSPTIPKKSNTPRGGIRLPKLNPEDLAETPRSIDAGMKVGSDNEVAERTKPKAVAFNAPSVKVDISTHGGTDQADPALEEAIQDEAFFVLDRVLQEVADADAEIIMLVRNKLAEQNARLHNVIIERACVVLDKLNKIPSITLLMEARQLLGGSQRKQNE